MKNLTITLDDCSMGAGGSGSSGGRRFWGSSRLATPASDHLLVEKAGAVEKRFQEWRNRSAGHSASLSSLGGAPEVSSRQPKLIREPPRKHEAPTYMPC